MPKFEIFDRKAKPKVDQPLVTLQASGMFSMNEAAFKALGEPEEVDLLYAPDEQIVGFRAAVGSPHAYPVKPQQNARTFQTGGRAFCQHYGIETGQARRFAAELQDDILMIDLKGESITVGRNGRPRKGA